MEEDTKGKEGTKGKEELHSDTILQQLMKRKITEILQYPTKNQIYEYISLKLGAFYKRFWQNKRAGLKQNTRKASDIIGMAEKMNDPNRQDDRYIKVCSYARQINKFQSNNYQNWRVYIWEGLDEGERKIMQNYVEELTPPPLREEQIKTQSHNEEQIKKQYQHRQRQKMFKAYKTMKRGMLLVEVFEKIWTIRKYQQKDKTEDENRHKALTKEILKQISYYHPQFQEYLKIHLGKEEWEVISKL